MKYLKYLLSCLFAINISHAFVQEHVDYFRNELANPQGDRFFTQLDLSGADLSLLNFGNSFFYNVNLRGANLTGAVLTGGTFNTVDCTKTCMVGVWAEKTTWKNVSLCGVNFQQGVFNSAQFERVDVTKSDFRNSFFNDVVFTSADGFAYTNFYEASKRNILLSFSYNSHKEFDVVFCEKGIRYYCNYKLRPFFPPYFSELSSEFCLNEDLAETLASKNTSCLLCDKLFLASDFVVLFSCLHALHIDCSVLFKKNPSYFNKKAGECPSIECGRLLDNDSLVIIPFNTSYYGDVFRERKRQLFLSYLDNNFDSYLSPIQEVNEEVGCDDEGS